MLYTHFAHLDGVLTESAWGKVERTMSDLVACLGVQQWWQVRRHWHTPEVGTIVSSRVDSNGLSIYGVGREQLQRQVFESIASRSS
jgi:hypothetical protein